MENNKDNVLDIDEEILQGKDEAINALVTEDKSDITQSMGSAIIESKFGNVNKFTEEVKKQMTAGTDYGVIATGMKPTLLKAGAEKIILLLGVQPRYEIVREEIDLRSEEPYVYYRFKCSLTKMINGEAYIVAEGFGSSNSKEKKNGKANIADIENTTLKIAKKRAMVDAALAISGMSNGFTQDVEDGVDLSIGTENDPADKFQKLRIYSKVYKTFGLKTESQQQKGKDWLNARVEEFAFETAEPFKNLLEKKISRKWFSEFKLWLEEEITTYYFNEKSSKIFKLKDDKKEEA